MLDWFNMIDEKLQVVIISSITSVLIFIFGWVIKVFYERNSLNFKLLKEFEFEQKRRLKEEIAKNKIPLLNIVEDLNHRIWNFKENIDKNWHNITQEDWENKEKYYLKSFVYRFLVLIHWVIKVERDTVTIDSTIADKKDLLFLKFIKSFKNIFCSTEILNELNYKNDGHNTNHFFKDDLIGYSKFVLEGNRVVDFDEFKMGSKNKYSELKEVIQYFTNIQNNKEDKNLNVLMCFHLVAISFLNEFGHQYQKTESKKLKDLTFFYKDKIHIKRGFEKFVSKNKLSQEMKPIINELK